VSFSDTIVRVLGDEFIIRTARRLARGSTGSPVGTICGIIEYDEASGKQKMVNVFEITQGLFVCMGSINVSQRNRATKYSNSFKKIDYLRFLCPKLEKLVGACDNVMR
jgi:hypothetical protein